MSVKATNWAWELGHAGVVQGGELLTLLRIADHADNGGVCWPGEEHLADYTSQGERTVRRHLNDLAKAGLLHRERVARDEGRGRSYDGIVLHLEDQPAKLAGKKSDDQPATDDRPTGQMVHDQPATDDTPLYREPTEEPTTNRVCTAEPRVLPPAIEDPLRQAAEAKEAVLDAKAVRRSCEAFADRDHAGEAEKFTAWHLHGDGRNAPLRNVAQGFKNWLKRSAPSTKRSALSLSGSTAPVVETKRASEAWEAAKRLLTEALPSATIATWIAPLEVAGERDGKLVLVDTTDNGGIATWVDRRYRPLILEAMDGFDDIEIVDETQLELEAA